MPSKEMLVAAIIGGSERRFRIGWFVYETYETIGCSYVSLGFFSPVNVAINWEIPPTKAKIAAIIYHTKMSMP